jgi:hypothetical protein
MLKAEKILISQILRILINNKLTFNKNGPLRKKEER